MAKELMKYPISACLKLWKAVVKSTSLLAEPIGGAVLGVPSPQYLCKGK